MNEILKEMIDLVDSKQGINTTVIDVRDITSIADFIVIVTSNSLVHSRSMSKYILDLLNNNTNFSSLIKNKNLELNNPWILIDGGEILINIFLKETREFYNLEKLYFKGKVIFDSTVNNGKVIAF